jgi:hypothetical protein
MSLPGQEPFEFRSTSEFWDAKKTPATHGQVTPVHYCALSNLAKVYLRIICIHLKSCACRSPRTYVPTSTYVITHLNTLLCSSELESGFCVVHGILRMLSHQFQMLLALQHSSEYWNRFTWNTFDL